MVTRRTDPERRDRIIDSALAVIAESGVAGTSHRRVAAHADVPLGSMTYHFDSMDDLLRESFTRFAAGISERFDRRLAAVRGTDELAGAIAELAHRDAAESPEELVLTLELYTLAARHPAFRQITHEWMRRSRAALERHVDATRAHQLDALIEGMAIHLRLDPLPHDRSVTLDAVRRVLSD